MLQLSTTFMDIYRYELPLQVGRAFAPRLGTTQSGEGLHYFAIKKVGKMVATSALCLKDGLAGIYCVATISTERGKGLGAHVTAEPCGSPITLATGLGCYNPPRLVIRFIGSWVLVIMIPCPYPFGFHLKYGIGNGVPK